MLLTLHKILAAGDHLLLGWRAQQASHRLPKPPSTLHPLQEVAGNHAVGMWGRSDEGFASLPVLKDYLFVMTRLQIRMYTYPKW